ncbi:MAG: formylglycine-generating enzyme family protein, partial [Myxococcota bacterium]
GGACAVHPCANGTRDGDETDVDCGGSCAPCADGASCQVAADCGNGVCDANVCGSASCNNGVKDGLETDVDCGGSHCQACLAGEGCGAGTDCVSGTCKSGSCSRCVEVPPPGGGDGYCIDATEVTQGQYAAFLQAGTGTNSQPNYCEWNNNYQPATSGGDCTSSSFAPSTHPDRPVVCIDWCDAAAYCAWAGMRLCGAIGGNSTDFDNNTSAAASQWHNACTASGANVYAYGSAFEPLSCNGQDYGAAASVPVGQASACTAESAPFSSLRDMSGNVWEWEDACESYKNKHDKCHGRGGGYATATLSCSQKLTVSRSTVRADLGFRCCN